MYFSGVTPTVEMRFAAFDRDRKDRGVCGVTRLQASTYQCKQQQPKESIG